MKELMLVGQYDPFGINLGGMEIYMQNLIYELQRKKIKISVIGWSHKKIFQKNFKAIVYSKKLLGRKFTFNLLVKSFFLKIKEDIPILVDRPDRVIPFLFRKNKIVCFLHGSHASNVYEKKGKFFGNLYSFFEKISLRRSNKIISVSNDNKNVYLKKYPFLKGKIDVIPIGFSKSFKPVSMALKIKNRKKYGLKKDENIALYLGRLEKEKQVDKIIKSFIGLKDKLLIVGSGREEANLKKLSKDSKNILFLGNISHEQVNEVLSASDILVLFSKFEGLPTVIVEAFACGVPVVSSDVGDISLLVKDGKTGYLVNEKDLKQRINLLFKNSNKFKNNCLDVSKEYSWENISERLVKSIFDI